MINYLIVSLGAAIGGALRYWLSGFVHKFLPASFPYGTLSVNVLGSFLLGLIIFFLDSRQMLSHQMKIFLTIGFCGGFTTFSTFSFETVNLLRHSEFFFALLNILLNVILCLTAVYIASLLSQK
ncbi:MAG: fluoride efflux transporter CrcB [Ignavibacteriales bacterium]|nr:fluoride efflux transporter CrcB [Ignavibacteriales bacterium]